MISATIETVLNKQINREMYSAYLYMSMSQHSATMGLKGISNWFMCQYHEEMLHAMKMYEYVQRQGGKVTLETIDKPPSEWSSALTMFEDTLAHEQQITSHINDLMEEAIADKDHATQIFLQWYVSEQVEEEENDNDIIAQLKLIGNDAQGLLSLDKELATRTVSVPLDYSKGINAAMKSGA